MQATRKRSRCVALASAALSLGCVGVGLWSYRGDRSVEWSSAPKPCPPSVGLTPVAAGFACPPAARAAPSPTGPSCEGPRPVSNHLYAAAGRFGFQRFQPLFRGRSAVRPKVRLFL